jgi:hypothetical protein
MFVPFFLGMFFQQRKYVGDKAKDQMLGFRNLGRVETAAVNVC